MEPNTRPLQADDRLAALEAEVAALRAELAGWTRRYTETAMNTALLMSWTGLIGHQVELEQARARRPQPVRLCPASDRGAVSG